MNQNLKTIQDLLQQNKQLTEVEKEALLKAVADADKQWSITELKLDRTEKVKKTTGILLEETIEELEQKRKAVEAQNRELEIESSLERVRTVAMSMNKPDDLLSICEILFHELQKLGFSELRNAMIDIHYDDKAYLLNYDYAENTGKTVNPYVYNAHPVIDNLTNHARQSNGAFTEMVYSGEALNEWRAFRKKSGEADDPRLDNTDALYYYFYAIGTGAIGISTFSAANGEKLDVLKRFRNVFDLAYKRYVDITNAEAQAREAQIQLALERVRARTMAMQKSDELSETALLMFEQIQSFGFTLWSCGFNIFEKEDKECTSFIARGGEMLEPVKLFFPENEFMWLFYESKQKEEELWVMELSEEDSRSIFGYVAKQRQVQTGNASFLSGVTLPPQQTVHLVNFLHGNLMFITPEPHPELHDIFKRFGKVFEQTYTRFLDLQKAEAQARESQIQLALERVRARTMAMQKHEDLLGVLGLLVEQLIKLGVHLEVADFSNGIPNGDWDLWIEVVRGDGTTVNNYVHFPQIDHPYFHQVEKNIETFKSTGKDLFKDVFSKEDKDLWQEYVYTQTIYKDITTEKDWEYLYDKPGYAWSMILLKDTWVSICRYNTTPFSDEEDALFRRFVNAFGQAYTRFLDLQKAEAQTREAQIEAALERVRASTMSMHKSEDLAKTAAVLFAQLNALGNTPDRISIGIIHEPEGVADMWLTDQSGNEIDSRFILNLNEKTTVQKLVRGWKAGLKSMIVDLTGEELKTWLNYVREIGLIVKDEHFKNRRVHNVAFFSHGWLNISVLEPLSPDMINILERFAAVYSLTYRRFLDLKTAEMQAREALIEVALERVRGKAMAMHNSADLSSAASVVFTELKKLGIRTIRSGISLQNKENRKNLLYTSTSTDKEEDLSLVGWAVLDDHPVLKEIYDSWMRGEDYFPVIKADVLKSYYGKIKSSFVVPPAQAEDCEQHGYFIAFTHGMFYGWAEKQFDDNEKNILKRFASVVDLTFKRYFDLQKAEANTKEAIKQAALDRIRADIASMRTVNDLDRITPLIWNELTILGISFIRCGVFIMDDQQQLIHTFLSTPEGTAIAAFHIPYNTPGNIAHVLSHWNNKENYIDHWNESDFTEFAKILTEQGEPDLAVQYLEAIPHLGFYLHFLPFMQGMLYVGNTTQLDNEEIRLIQSVANAFSTAYARYEDFNKLEAAKRQVEKTLGELKQTQQQLVQAEKMASLGELTAGIAHEIQNPLNFVNNFSEVNEELLSELVDEFDKGNAEEAKAIANDIKQNLEKINYHGKRADAIVKGMLQHSRKNTGQKEPADINALCDEYLRLSYHGLRAKDKSFNADFKTDFDTTIGKINIVPQDIGRVLLNLINNAFYAVTEKSKNLTGLQEYQPTVSVQTKKVNDKVEITIKDNGNGISSSIKEKIFQPFFTTKPTGQGTGLGLSLSYDIIKAHGGEIKVETKEGEGSEFTIQLPA